MRASLNDILYSFTAQDVDGMTKAILSVTQFDNGLNRAVLSQDVEQMLGRYSGIDLGSLYNRFAAGFDGYFPEKSS